VAPSIALVGDRWGWTPLHLAVRRNADVTNSDDATARLAAMAAVDIVNVLVDAVEDAAERQDSNDRSTPLHLAAQFGASNAVIRALADASPDSGATRDRRDRTALHLAAARGVDARADVISSLLLCNVASGTAVDDAGRTPLHYAARNGASSDVIAMLCASSPAALKVQDAEGSSPLHCSVARRGGDPAVTSALIDASPEAMRLFNRRGSRPLRIALEARAPASVVLALLAGSAAPAADVERTDGSTALHLAVAIGMDVSVLRALIEADRIAKVMKPGMPCTLTRDRDGNIPLHLAIAAHAPVATIALLLAAEFESASTLNKMKLTPLHTALLSQSEPATVRCILDADPATIEHKDSQARLPLHNALYSDEVVLALLALDPAAVHVADAGKMTPLHIAVRVNASAAVVQALLDIDSSAADAKCGELTALQIVAEVNGAKEIVDIILKHANEETVAALPRGLKSWTDYAPTECVAEHVDDTEENIAAVVSEEDDSESSKPDVVSVAELESEPADETDAIAALRERYAGLSLESLLFTEMSADSAGSTALYLCTKSLPPASIEEWTKVKWFVESFPEVGMMVDANFQRAPLLWAVEKGAPRDVVFAMLDAAPQAARTKDKWGWGALHLALRRSASSDIVLALIDADATMTSALPSNGNLPLHIAAAKQASIAVMRRLLKESPDSISTLDRQQRTPLHHAVDSSAPRADVATALIVAYPAAASLKDSRGDAPLQIAARQCIDLNVITMLAAIDPTLASAIDSKKTTALHHAVRLGASVPVVRCLLASAKEASTVQDRAGNRPLMLALRNSAATPVVLALLRAAASTAADVDRLDMSTCMHRAVENNASPKVIRALVENDLVVQVVNSSPPIIRVKNKDGITPLQRAIEVSASPDTVAALLESDPTAVMATDENGRTALHRAAQQGASAQVLSVLISAAPGVVELLDLGGRSALHLCAGEADAVRVLLDATPSMAATQDEQGMLPLHHASRRGGPLTAVQTLLMEAPETAVRFDHIGRAPLHCALELWNQPRLLDALSRFSGEIATKVAVSYGFFVWNTVQIVRARDEAKRIAENPIVIAVAPLAIVAPKVNAQPWIRGVTREGVSYYINTNESTSVWQLPPSVDPSAVRDDTVVQNPLATRAPAGLLDTSGALTHPVVAAALLKLSQFTEQTSVPLSLWANVMNAAREFPKSLLDKDKYFGRAPLLWAIEKDAPSEVLIDMIAVAPKAVRMEDKFGYAALHLALRRQSAEEVVLALIDAQPSLAYKSVPGDQSLPLHIAAAKQASVVILKSLLSAAPDSISAIDKSKRTPLHHALDVANPHTGLVTALVIACPQNASVRDARGDAPLHIAARCPNVDPDIISMLISLDPSVVSACDSKFATPLHHAVRLGAPLGVVQSMLAAASSATSVQNRAGDRPLTVALRNSAATSVVLSLLRAGTSAASDTDHVGNTCMHHAIENNASVDVIKLLVENDIVVQVVNSSPPIVRVPNNDGVTPLQRAIEVSAPPFIVEALLESDPTAVMTSDEKGRTVLHQAAQQGSNGEFLSVLMNAAPEVAGVLDAGGRSAMHLCAGEVDALQILLDVAPSMVVTQDAQGMLPLHHAAQRGQSIAAVQLLFTSQPAAATSVNADGLIPFELAVQSRASLAILDFLAAKAPAVASRLARSLGMDAWHAAAVLAMQEQTQRAPVDKLEPELVPTAAKEVDVESALVSSAPLESFAPSSLWAPGTVLNTALVGSMLLELCKLPETECDMHDWAAALCAAKDFPDALMQTDKYFGRTPLAWALDKQIPGAVVSALIELGPQAAAVTDKWGQAALHLGLRRGVDTSVALALIDAEPAMVSLLRTGDRCWPLHIAAAQQASVQTIRRLLAVAPTAVSARDKLRRMPLHYAVDNESPRADVVTALLVANSAAASIKDGRGDAPLHIAARRCIDPEVITALLAIDPSIGSELDSKRSTALHHAVRKAAPLSVVHCLLTNAPGAVSVQDHAGNCPLTVALTNAAPTAVVLALLRASSGAAGDVDRNDGSTCMHRAVENNASVDVIFALAEADIVVQVVNSSPPVIRVRNKLGRTPLQRAIELDKSPDFVTALLESDRSVVVAQDDTGRTILHDAASHGSSADILSVLIDSSPSVAVITDNGLRSPLHLCTGDATAVRLLLDAAPTMALAQDAFGMVPLHHAVRRAGSIDAVRALADGAPGAGAVMDNAGQTALHTAVNALASEEMIQAIVASSQKAAVDIATSFGVADWWRVLAILEERRDSRVLDAAAVETTADESPVILPEERETAANAESQSDHPAITDGGGDDSDEMLSYFGPATFYSTNPAIVGQALVRICQQQSLPPDSPQWKQLLIMAELHPEALIEVDQRCGRCALQWAAFNSAPLSVVRKLLDFNVAAAAVQDKWSWTALHLALRRHRSAAMVKALLDAAPDASSIADQNDSSTALHLCAAHGQYPGSVLKALIASAPGVADMADSKRRLPLHRLAESGKASVTEFTSLLFANVDAASKCTSAGEYALHLALKSGTCVDVVMLLIATYPAAVALSDTSGVYPLHYVCNGKFNYPVGDCNVVKTLHTAAPLIAKELDRHGSRPLIHALQRGFPIETIKMLLKASQDAILDVDIATGSTVLHCAVRGNVGAGVVRMIVEADTIARVIKPHLALIYTEDADRTTPLRLAIELPAPPSVVCELVRGDPSDVCPIDGASSTVLHLALASPNLLDKAQVVETMLKAYPRCCDRKDRDGRTPLHVAVANNAPLEVVQILMGTAPLAASEEDHAGVVPLQSAMEAGLPSDVIAYLSEASPHTAVGLLISAQVAQPTVLPKASRDTVGAVLPHLPPTKVEIVVIDELEAKREVAEETGADIARTSDVVRAAPLAAVPRDVPLRDVDPEYAASLEAALVDLSFEAAQRYITTLCLRPQRDQTTEVWLQVKRLVQLHPILASGGDARFGRTPLHWAANARAPLNVMKVLIDANKSCVTLKDKRGKTPIALALQRGLSTQVVLAMLNAHTDALRCDGANGGTLLHTVFMTGANVEIVATLVERMPESSLAACDRDGRTALHIAAANNAPYAAVKILLDAAPGCTAIQDKRLHATPLHLAPVAIRGSYCSDDVLMLLTKASRGAACLPNRNGQLPLHTLLESGHRVTPELIMLSLFHNRESAAHADAFGRTPVILAMTSNAVTTDMRLTLVGAASVGGAAAVGSIDQRSGRAALHFCAANDASIVVIRALIAAAPGAAKVFDRNNKCPLALAVENASATEAVVECILGVAPATVTAELDAGRTALHAAVERDFAPETVKMLLEADMIGRLSSPEGSPRSALLVLDDAGCSPLQLAIKRQRSTDVIRRLVAGNTAAAGFCTRERQCALHHLMQEKPRANTEAICSILLEAAAETTSLADRNGFVPLHYACISAQSVSVLQLLCASAQDMLSWTSSVGDTPLHTMLQRVPASVERVRMLVDLCPEWTNTANSGGLVPMILAMQHHDASVVNVVVQGVDAKHANMVYASFLSLCCAEGVPTSRWPAIVALVQAQPSVAFIVDDRGRTPLLLAVSQRARPSVVLAILAVDAAAAAIKDTFNKTALQRAAEVDAPRSVVSAIALASPLTATEVVIDNALRRVSIRQPSEEEWANIAALVGKFPHLLSTINSSNDPLLHRLLQLRTPCALVQNMIAACPGAVSLTNASGQTPLHIAIAQQQTVDFVAYVLGLNSAAAMAVDSTGMTPLHVAAMTDSSSAALRLLLGAAPEAARCVDKWGMTPLHLTVRRGGTAEDISLLLDAAPSAADAPNARGLRPLQIAMDTAALGSDALALIASCAPTTSVDIVQGELVQVQQLTSCFAELDVERLLCILKAQPVPAISIIDAMGNTLLHQLILLDEVPIELLRVVFTECTGHAGMCNAEECFPIDSALDKELPTAFVLDLARAEPRPAIQAVLSRLLNHALSFTPEVWHSMAAIVQQHPESMQGQGSVERTPLHLVVLRAVSVRDVPVEMVEAILVANPQAASVEDTYGRTAFRIATEQRAATDILAALKAYSRDTVVDIAVQRFLDRAATTPVTIGEWAAMSKIAVAQPSVLTLRSKRSNATLLHAALMSSAPEAVLLDLIAAYPKAASVRDAEGRFPLQIAAAMRSVSSTVLHSLASCAPGVAARISVERYMQNEGRVMTSESLAQLLRLVGSYPEAACVCNTAGQTILHIALQGGLPIADIDRLLDVSPEAASVCDAEGRTALHVAAANGDVVSVASLLKVAAETARWTDATGHSPLHLASMSTKKRGGAPCVAMLFAVAPERARLCNSDGKTPLHSAFEHGAPANSIRMLVEAAPEVVCMQEKGTRYTPLHRMVYHKRWEGKTVADICKKLSAAALMRDSRGRSPLQLARVQGAPVECLAALAASTRERRGP
jgi:ankyrin repeat protein